MNSMQEYFQKLLRFILDSIAFAIEWLIPSKSGRRYLPPISDPILLQSAVSLSENIKQGKFKSEDVVKAFINRIKEVDQLVNAVVEERFEEAIKEAQEVDRKLASIRNNNYKDGEDAILKLPLLGVPFTGKDSIAIKSMGLTAGLVARKSVKANEDAVSIANIRKAGAIPLALTNVPELLLWLDSNNNLYGRCNNPYDLSLVPGGSSGGNAACIAYAGSVIGIGSDIGGSIRMPAFCCGIFGHKTTPGIVDIKGHYPDFGERGKFLSFGPMTRYACDLKPFLKAMAGENIKKLPKIDEKVDFKKLKFYYAEESGEATVSPVEIEIRKSIKKVVEHFSNKFGSRVTQHKFNELEHSYDIFMHTFYNFSSQSIASLITENRGKFNIGFELFKTLFGFSDHTLPLLLAAMIEKFSSQNENTLKNNPNYVKMGLCLKEHLHSLLGDDGVFIYPSLPFVAPKHQTTLFKLESLSYISVFNVLDVTITQCPIGLNQNGLPLGVQIVATSHNDHLTIAVAEELEHAFGGWTSPSDILCVNNNPFR
ncbi:fatty-acid amide hydrolase 2-like protein [Dinothrombium tinctorium]|uniref:Fatty-acid amide hydrolase 2-like protein n=1 Tax=Dinothrombium tinctorium TaxID=1965070 RepID=A0A443REQ2_9ACAR|nr:fatty-acid amide hydrolase 2-like protein [Dinothrombium tinctorium]